MIAEKKQQNRKAALLQNAVIALCGGAVLLLAVLLILETVSSLKTEDLVVKEPVTVASSSLSPLNAENKIYSSHVTGVIFNTTSRAIRVEKMHITVIADGAERTVELETFLIPARSSYDVSEVFESGSNYRTVDRISVEFDGRKETLSNLIATNGWEKSGAALMLYAVLLVPSAWLLAVAVKKRYYIFQESKIEE